MKNLKTQVSAKQSQGEFVQDADLTEQIRVYELISQFEQCDTCGTRLQYVYRSDWIKRQVLEKGHCSTCQCDLPTRSYPLC